MRGNVGCLPLVVLALVACVGIGLGVQRVEYGTQHNVTFTVTGLDDQTSSSSSGTSHKYLVFTKRADGKNEVFENTDTILHGKTDSSDVWARFINAGKDATWTCPVYGFRLFFFSSYRNILDGCVLVHKAGQPSNASIGTRDPLAG